MHLIYLDESGNSGLNLNDAQQPVFVLCALIVEDRSWQALDAELHSVVAQLPKSIDDTAYHIIEPLIYRGDEAFVDVIAWLTSEEKKKRPGS